MKKDEFKKCLLKKADELIDVYFGENTIIDKMANSTLKVYLNTNMNKIDGILDTVTDANGEVDAKSIIDTYSDNIPQEGVNFDIRKFIKNDFIISILPDKSLNITKEDFSDIINNGG